jgi:transposase
MAHGTRVTSLAERVRIGELAAQGWTTAKIAVHLGWSVATVRKWRQRAQQGWAALHSRMGRPRQGPLVPHSLRDRALRAQVRRWREQHPGWGPNTLRAELARDPAFAGSALPSPATLGRFLQAEGLSRAYQRHTTLPAIARARPSAPHQEWEMDARGHAPVPGVGVVTLVHLNDRYSHARLLSYPFVLGEHRATRHLQTEDYQLALRLAFGEWGLPDRLAVDHESVFYDNDSPSPFPSRLHLWLAALGVTLVFGRVRQPTDQGLTERSHQLWAAQVLEGQQFAGVAALVAALRERRTFLNEHLPCRSLDNLPPLEAYPRARQPRRRYRPEEEGGGLDLARVWAYLGAGRWFRRVATSHTISLGGQVYYLGRPWIPGSEVAITADAAAHLLRVTAADGTQQEVVPRGLDAATLMGDLARIVQVPGYQPSLPFTLEAERLLRLCEILP